MMVEKRGSLRLTDVGLFLLQASVYLSTAEGLYVVPISNCSIYSDCW